MGLLKNQLSTDAIDGELARHQGDRSGSPIGMLAGRWWARGSPGARGMLLSVIRARGSPDAVGAVGVEPISKTELRLGAPWCPAASPVPAFPRRGRSCLLAFLVECWLLALLRT